MAQFYKRHFLCGFLKVWHMFDLRLLLLQCGMLQVQSLKPQAMSVGLVKLSHCKRRPSCGLQVSMLACRRPQGMKVYLGPGNSRLCGTLPAGFPAFDSQSQLPINALSACPGTGASPSSNTGAIAGKPLLEGACLWAKLSACDPAISSAHAATRQSASSQVQISHSAACDLKEGLSGGAFRRGPVGKAVLSCASCAMNDIAKAADVWTWQLIQYDSMSCRLAGGVVGGVAALCIAAALLYLLLLLQRSRRRNQELQKQVVQKKCLDAAHLQELQLPENARCGL